MAHTTNLSSALRRSWDHIAPAVHERLRKQFLTAEEVKQALREELDAQTIRNRNARDFWHPLTDAEKQAALDRAIEPGVHWLVDENGEPLPKPAHWQ